MGGHANYKPTKYFSIHDVPDELVMQHSKRDPNNPIYKTRRWVNMKKKQIFFSQMDGVPNYLRTPLGRFSYYSALAMLATNFVYNMYLFNKMTSGKK